MSKSEGNPDAQEQSRLGVRLVSSLGAIVVLALIFWGCVFGFARKPPPQRILLGDGRILQIEGVTYGTKHRIGRSSSFLEHFGPWLPGKMRQLFEPKYPESRIDLERAALVVWVNAIDPKGETNVDCQGISTGFVDKHGDVFGDDHPHWFGGQKFWRVGHVFYSYPRDERELTWQVTSWRANKAGSVQFLNPNLTQPLKWSGDPLPQTNTVGELEIVLSGLNTRTTGGKKKYWEPPGTYWEPAWEFHQHGQAAPGWEKPEWNAEDSVGNRGQFPGVHQPVLRFSVTVYPKATNTEAAATIAVLPKASLAGLNTNIWWNRNCQSGSNEIVVLGICPPGMHEFCRGVYDTNGPHMGATRGGAPSGWVGTEKRINPVQIVEWDGHYTPSPTLYIRAPELRQPERFAVRLRDDQGRYWPAKPEPEGAAHGIMPFLIELPPTVTNVVPEVVLLRPVRADFLVQTEASNR